jgi:hypothetical protein
MNWQPTCELRWLEVAKEIEIANPTPDLVSMTVTHQVLEQKWVQKHQEGEMYEWRDVPVEKEA